MWISREELNVLKNRISALETAQNITVYKPLPPTPPGYPVSYYGMYQIETQKIGLQNAIRKILAHLKLELKYVEGQPKTVEVGKV